jgi:hypothetical protein
VKIKLGLTPIELGPLILSFSFFFFFFFFFFLFFFFWGGACVLDARDARLLVAVEIRVGTAQAVLHAQQKHLAVAGVQLRSLGIGRLKSFNLEERNNKKKEEERS